MNIITLLEVRVTPYVTMSDAFMTSEHSPTSNIPAHPLTSKILIQHSSHLEKPEVCIHSDHQDPYRSRQSPLNPPHISRNLRPPPFRPPGPPPTSTIPTQPSTHLEKQSPLNPPPTSRNLKFPPFRPPGPPPTSTIPTQPSTHLEKPEASIIETTRTPADLNNPHSTLHPPRET